MTNFRQTMVKVGNLIFGGTPLVSEDAGETGTTTEQQTETPPPAETAPEDQPKEPCATCGAEGCACGESCTEKGCGCCEACTAMKPAEGEEPEPTQEPEPSGDAAAKTQLYLAQAEITALKTKLAAALSTSATQAATVEDERTKRINTEVTTLMAKVGAHWGMEKRTVFQVLIRGVKLGVVSLQRVKPDAAQDAPEAERYETLTATISPEASEILSLQLEALAASEPGASLSRIAAGGEAVDRAAREVAADEEPDPAEIGREAARRVRKTGVAEGSPGWLAAYTAMIETVTKERGGSHGARR